MEIRDPRRLPLGAIYTIINTTSHSNLSASIPFSLCLALPVSSMALRRTFVKRLIDGYRAAPRPVTLEHCPPLGTIIPPGTARTNSNRGYLTSPDSGERGFFRRFLNRRALYQTEATKLPEFLSLPVGEKLREKLRRLNVTGDLLRPERPKSVALHPATGDSFHEFTVKDARRLLRLAQMEKLKAKLRKVPNSSIPYLEFLQICTEGCKDKDQGLEFAKLLDDSGNVVVLGNIVFLRPEQVAKSMESMIYQSMAFPNDPRRKELEQMEEQKAVIDQKAKTLVRGELYCGLGFLTIQTLGFMRLTFWELSWDVMEPICFFVTSLHFAMAYTFFLRTSTEPSFEGYFQRRFKAKQKKLMTVHNFDIEKYNELCKLFYPESLYPSPTSGHHPFHCLNAIHS